MTRPVCQLVHQSDGTWLVSLGADASSRNGGQTSRTREAGSGLQQAASAFDEPAHEASLLVEGLVCKVIFNGVLYNRAGLSERFASSAASSVITDADLILRAYLRRGEDVLHELRGIFALLIWDERRNTLLCVRDQLGVYPLFYADAGRQLLLSTSIEALIQHPGVSDAVNRAALTDYLCYRTQKSTETFYESVSRVPPGHVMKVEGARRRAYRYWNPVPDVNDVNWVSEDELERFDELLDQAVDRCLRLGQAGIFLSGGLDSVSVAAVAADNSRRKGLADPLALSLIFPHPECNEEDVQRRVGLQLGLQHELMPLEEAAGPKGLLTSAVEMSSGRSAPLFNPWAPAYQSLGLEGKRRGRQVILTGGGGDEWLTVSPYHAADLLRSLDFGGLYQLWNTSQRSYHFSRLAFSRNILWRFGARPLINSTGRKILRQRAPGILQKRWQKRIARSTPGWVAPDPALRREIDQRMEQNLSSKSTPQSFYFEEVRQSLDHPLVSMEMEENFENGKRTGLPLLMPYWDADLVDFLYRTPPELLNKGERTKAMVRKTVARRFPHLNFERQKKVQSVDFFSSLLLSEGARLWKSMGGASALAELGIVDTPSLNSTMAQLFTGSRPARETHRIRDLLLVEAWLRPQLGMPLSTATEGRISIGTR